MVRIDEHGNTEIAVHNNKWYAIKNKDDSKVIITNYEEENCIIKDSEKDPLIVLNGEEEITLKAGETYEELGASAKTIAGNELEYTITIILDGSIVEKVDTNIAGVYQLTYQVSSNGKFITVIRLVTVKKAETMAEIIAESPEVMSNDPDGNPRYVGANPNNYVQFNQELWRVIGVSVRPVLYLKSDVGIQSGTGTSTDPYILF